MQYTLSLHFIQLFSPILCPFLGEGLTAKAAFDKQKLKKLPKVKALSAEYQELLAEKRKLYPEYRRARDEMRELLTVKANVDRIMNQDKEKDKEKDRQTDRD